MKAMKRLGQGMLVAIAVLGLAGAASAGPKAISSCKTINEPGSYLVTKNLTANGTCFLVATDDVTIDLGGYRVWGNGTGSGVESGAFKVVVRNGSLMNFAHGVHLYGQYNVVDHVRVSDGGNGIWVGEGSLVKSSVVGGNGGPGIVLECPASAIGNAVTDNAGGNLLTFGAGCVLFQNLAP